MIFSVSKSKNAKFLAKQWIYQFIDKKIDFYVIKNGTTIHIKKGVFKNADAYKIPIWFNKKTKKVKITQYLKGKLKNSTEYIINQ